VSKVKVWDEKKKKFLIIGEVIEEKGQKILVKRGFRRDFGHGFQVFLPLDKVEEER